jgi:hypothetical protein
MRDWRDRLEAATVLRDEGVLLGYVSAGHERLVAPGGGGAAVGEVVDPLAPPDPERAPEALRAAARTRLDGPDPAALDEADVAGFEAGWDPLARELYANDLLGAALRESAPAGVRRYAESIVHAHEATHAALADREAHFYRAGFDSQLFLLTRVLEAHSYGRSVPTELYGRITEHAWETLTKGELTQEAVAFDVQRRYLDRERPGVEPPSVASFRRMAAEAVGEGRPTERFETNPVHPTADWLRERLADAWTLDPATFAFAFYHEGGGSLPPDVVLLAAAAVAPERVADTDAAEEWRLLVDAVRAYCQGGGLPAPAKVVGAPDDAVDLPTPTRDAVARDARRSVLERATDSGRHDDVAVLARRYPGQPRGRTLNDLLWATYAVRHGGTRRLLLPPGYDWALGTRLLELAVALLRFHDAVLMPPVRMLRAESGYDTVLLDSLIDIADGADPGAVAGNDLGLLSTGDTVEAANACLEWSRDHATDYREAYEDVCRLGRAVLRGDEAAVGEFL